jgi:predicted dehydrogenase
MVTPRQEGGAVRVGIIGRGWGERVVAPAFNDTDGCEVVDVVTPRDQAGVAALCMRGDVDLISVHSPPFMHLEHVRMATEGSHAVLCDKPFGRNAEEARAMCALAEDAGVPTFLNFEHRFDESRRRLHQLVTEGVVGEPEHVNWTMLLAWTREPLRPYGWIFDGGLAGGWLRAAGSHLIDFARWTFGEVTEVCGQLRTTIKERPDAAGEQRRCSADDGFVANLRTERGVTLVIDSSSAARIALPHRIIVTGAAGVLEVIDERIVLHADGRTTDMFIPESDVYDAFAPQHAFAAVVRDAVRDGSFDGIPTFADGLACVDVMDCLFAGTTKPRCSA